MFLRRRRIVCVVGMAEGIRGCVRSAEDRRSRAVCLEATSIVDWRDRSEGREGMEG